MIIFDEKGHVVNIIRTFHSFLELFYMWVDFVMVFQPIKRLKSTKSETFWKLQFCQYLLCQYHYSLCADCIFIRADIGFLISVSSNFEIYFRNIRRNIISLIRSINAVLLCKITNKSK